MDLIMLIGAFICTYFTIFCLIHLLNKQKLIYNNYELKQKRIMIVFGSGGHTTEMLLMIKDLNFS